MTIRSRSETKTARLPDDAREKSTDDLYPADQAECFQVTDD